MLRIANPIYADVLPRVLTSVLQDRMGHRTAPYVDADGRLEMDRLLESFQDFFRRNSEHWIQRAQYTEAGPQLALQAFLDRVVNSRGRTEREYALGSGRVDLLVVWPGPGGRESRFVVECKLVGRGRSKTRVVERGLEQTAKYMDGSGTDAGHLVVFDMRDGRSSREKVYREEREWDGRRIVVWGGLRGSGMTVSTRNPVEAGAGAGCPLASNASMLRWSGIPTNLCHAIGNPNRGEVSRGYAMHGGVPESA